MPIRSPLIDGMRADVDDSGTPEERVARTLEPLGFVRRDGRHQWQREADGRSWRVSFGPQNRTRYYGELRTRQIQGWRLRIDITTRVMVRAYVVRAGIASHGVMRWFYRWRRFEHVPVPHGADGFEVVTSDAGWVEPLLREPAALQAFTALAEFRTGAGDAASVYFEPGGLHYASPLLQAVEVQAPRLVETIERLTVLAREADRQPPSARPVRLTAAERFLREQPYLVAIGFFVGVLALLAGGALFLMLLAWLALR